MQKYVQLSSLTTEQQGNNMAYLLTYQEPYESKQLLGLFTKEGDAIKEMHLQIDLHMHLDATGAFMGYVPKYFHILEMELQ
jgi:hypothetical protein